ncbi:MAG: dephospho-CoA kinase [Robiginitomaculum sp.]|nr:MAG: dephospho-CoA kinase [Robiginitomaculum sp.]
MIKIGLTGSIGMGKSTTASMFKEAGAYVFGADAAVHKLYAKNGAAVPLLRAVFPDIIVDGAVDRTKLLAHLKSDPLNIEVLESFIHPMVVSLREEAIKLAKASGAKIFVADIPLLFETGAQAYFDIIVVASAKSSVQRQRVLSRPGMTKEKYALILSRQLPDAQKRTKADYVVKTDKGMDFARNQVNTIVRTLGPVDN